MAVDTAAKRYSAMQTACQWRGPAVIPSGAIGQAARQAVALFYSGILASALAVTAKRMLALTGAGR